MFDADETDETEPMETRALTVRESAAIAPLAVTGEPWDGETARTLLCGVDTLYMSFDLPVSEAMWERLDQEQQIAQQIQQERRAVHCPEWLNAILRPTGAKGGYRFLIESDAWSLKLLRDIPNRPPIFVEMRAFNLKTHPGGVIGACQDVCTFLQDILLEDQDPRTVCQAINLDVARCSRLDLHSDWQGGWHPTLAEGGHRLFIRPGQVDWHPFLSGNVCTGYVFGKGHVLARLYNKTRQAKQSHLDWYFTLLEQHNGASFDPAQDVWRLEFQLTRAGVKGFRLATKQELTDPDEVIEAELDAEDLPSIGTVRKALHWAGQVWLYLTKRWLRLVEPDDDTNRGRWPIHPTWQVLRDSFVHAMVRSPLPDGKLQLVRAERHTGYKRLLDRMAVGVLSALDLADTDPGAVTGSWLAYMFRLAQAIKYKQEARQAEWQRRGLHTRAEDVRRHGMGATLDRARKVEELLNMGLGVFTSSGAAHSTLTDVGSVADLLNVMLEDFEALALEKGGMAQLLFDKRCKVYKATSSRGLFMSHRARAA
jgi:hypothetical protein